MHHNNQESERSSILRKDNILTEQTAQILIIILHIIFYHFSFNNTIGMAYPCAVSFKAT